MEYKKCFHKRFCSALLFANFLSNPRRIHSGQKDKEKEEYGLIWAIICCKQPLLSPLPPFPPAPSPPRLLRPPVAMLSGLEGRGRASPPPPHLIWNSFQQPRQKSRMASNLEVASVTAEIGQQ
jgi:hypothetical protein